SKYWRRTRARSWVSMGVVSVVAAMGGVQREVGRDNPAGARDVRTRGEFSVRTRGTGTMDHGPWTTGWSSVVHRPSSPERPYGGGPVRRPPHVEGGEAGGEVVHEEGLRV